MAGPTTTKMVYTWRGIYRRNNQDLLTLLTRWQALNVKAGTSRVNSFIPSGAPPLPVVTFPDCIANVINVLEQNLLAKRIVP